MYETEPCEAASFWRPYYLRLWHAPSFDVEYDSSCLLPVAQNQSREIHNEIQRGQ